MTPEQFKAAVRAIVEDEMRGQERWTEELREAITRRVGALMARELPPPKLEIVRVEHDGRRCFPRVTFKLWP